MEEDDGRQAHCFFPLVVVGGSVGRRRSGR